MPFEIVDPQEFAHDEVFREDDFKELIEESDWSKYQDKKVLVRGCGEILFPPWAFMTIVAKLVPLAKSVRYGNEHDNIVVYRRKKD